MKTVKTHERKTRNIRRWWCFVASLVFAAAAPAEAQSKYGPLFDTFNLTFAGSRVLMSTEFRLDSDAAGKGTVLNFEDDLNLGKNETVPTLGFDWQIARKHKLGVRWQDISRDSTSQALTEIDWGDETIPINADITLGFDTNQFFIDYAYYPWINDRWAFGFGGGFRVMDLKATLAYREENQEIEESVEVKGIGPLPYLYFEYRSLVSDNWRFITGIGWIYVEIGDIEGGHWIARANIEYLLGDRWSFGGAVNASAINVDWTGIETEESESVLTAAIDMDIIDLSFFARVRF